jgi:hypothetical protein
MQCNGHLITAIIDTRSQLTIVNQNICDTKIVRPVDNKEKISIADANRGQGKLEGLVKNIPLNCGEVVTQANLYVSTHVPFKLLLGRPWQRGNYVSIDEQLNGTYLLFKDWNPDMKSWWLLIEHCLRFNMNCQCEMYQRSLRRCSLIM